MKKIIDHEETRRRVMMTDLVRELSVTFLPKRDVIYKEVFTVISAIAITKF